MGSPTRRALRKRPGSRPIMILDLGTYWARRPAFRRPWLRTAAHRDDRQDRKGRKFPQVTGPYLRILSVGRLGLEPRTGGL
jgi:hypothetical protein